MTNTQVRSCSARCELTVSRQVLDNDVLLQWIIAKAPKFQLVVKEEKKGNTLSLQTFCSNDSGDKTAALTQRNSILRSLCGRALHSAMDQIPLLLLGGASGSTQPSPTMAATLSAITAWMSVADGLASESETAFADILQHLNAHLETRALLVPATSVPTLADLSMGAALLQDCALPEDVAQSLPNVARWLKLIHATLSEGVSDNKLKALPLPAVAPPVPVFYDGTEDAAAVFKMIQPKKPAAAAASGGGKKQEQGKKGGGDQQQNQGKKQQQQQGGKGKKNQQPKQQQQAAQADFDISALDIRVGKITKVWHHETADKLFCETIDLGTETREIASGLRPFYKMEDLQEKTVLVLCNLKKRNLVGFPSHGMVLCASNADHTQVQLVVPPEGTELGERVQFDGYSGDAEPENKIAKKKVFEKLAPDLKTNDKGEVVWKEALARTSKGVVQAISGMANGQVA